MPVSQIKKVLTYRPFLDPADHFTLLTAKLTNRIQQALLAKLFKQSRYLFLDHRPQQKSQVRQGRQHSLILGRNAEQVDPSLKLVAGQTLKGRIVYQVGVKFEPPHGITAIRRCSSTVPAQIVSTATSGTGSTGRRSTRLTCSPASPDRFVVE
jgi:hypothetical protein